MASGVPPWAVQLALIVLLVPPIYFLTCRGYIATSPDIHSFRGLLTEKQGLVYATFALYIVAGTLAAGAAWILHTDSRDFLPVSAGIIVLILAGLAVGFGFGLRGTDAADPATPDEAPLAIILVRGTGWVTAVTATLPFLTPLLF